MATARGSITPTLTSDDLVALLWSGANLKPLVNRSNAREDRPVPTETADISHPIVADPLYDVRGPYSQATGRNRSSMPVRESC